MYIPLIEVKMLKCLGVYLYKMVILTSYNYVCCMCTIVCTSITNSSAYIPTSFKKNQVAKFHEKKHSVFPFLPIIPNYLGISQSSVSPGIPFGI